MPRPHTSLVARSAAVALVAIAVILASCSSDDGGADQPPPTSRSVLTTAPSDLTTTTTTTIPGPAIYVIQPGDTLSGVAAQNGLTLDELLRANPAITDPTRLRPGDQIVIPEKLEAAETIPPEEQLTVPDPTEPSLPPLTNTTTTTEPATTEPATTAADG